MPRNTCALKIQCASAMNSAAPPRKVTMCCAHSPSLIIWPPSMWPAETKIERKPEQQLRVQQHQHQDVAAAGGGADARVEQPARQQDGHADEADHAEDAAHHHRQQLLLAGG